jgi:hypothetical protein
LKKNWAMLQNMQGRISDFRQKHTDWFIIVFWSTHPIVSCLRYGICSLWTEPMTIGTGLFLPCSALFVNVRRVQTFETVD